LNQTDIILGFLIKNQKNKRKGREGGKKLIGAKKNQILCEGSEYPVLKGRKLGKEESDVAFVHHKVFPCQVIQEKYQESLTDV
jgi:hypothetical protein